MNHARLLVSRPRTLPPWASSLSRKDGAFLAGLTVRENLVVASGLRGGITAQRQTLDMIFELFPILRQRFDSRAGNLSGGEQQQLAIARALLTRPRLLVVDEPSLGLAPKFVDLVYQTFAQLRASGVTLLLVEQSMRRALSLADRVYLLEIGLHSPAWQGSGACCAQ